MAPNPGMKEIIKPQGRNRPVFAAWTISATSTNSKISPNCMGASAPRPAKRSRRLPEMVQQSGEQPAPVGTTERRFDMVLRVRHHAQHVAAFVDDAGDGVHGAVVVPVRTDSAVARRVA